MKQHQLDLQRAEMMDALYEKSGRTNRLYTGLWKEFAHDVAVNFRDADYADLHAACVVAIGAADTHLAEKHAQQCIAVCRQFLLGKWG